MSDRNSLGGYAISDIEFAHFKKLIFQIAGIHLTDAKKTLLVGRLSKRLKHFDFTTFAQYFKHVSSGNDAKELQVMVDLLTTNETYFFREPKHFDFLREIATRRRDTSVFRIWSAAASSGEEAYSMAMVLADALDRSPWEIVGTDICTRVIEKARIGLYPLERAQGIPPAMLRKYCLKGVGEHDGNLLIARELRERVNFHCSNLMDPRKNLGQFDMIFLRNVMIYFENETKRKVVSNLLPYLKSNGHFIVGHSESLNGVTTELVSLRPTIYQRANSRPPGI